MMKGKKQTMNNIIKETMIKMFVKFIEGYIGKFARKFTVNIQDDGEQGFTITVKVFDSLNSVLKKAGNTLSGLLKKG